MSEVDYDAVVTANKALVVIFIISIALTSMLQFLLKVLMKVKSLDDFTVRRCIITLLNGGIFFYSIFTLVVQARLNFADIIGLTCSSTLTSQVYGSYLLPFVYACGLIVIAVELLIVGRASNDIQNLFIRLVYIAIPFALGLVVVLPLSLAGTKWDFYCYQNFTLDRQHAIVVISLIVPSLAVVAVAVTVMCIVSSSRPPASGHVFTTADGTSSPVVTNKGNSNSAVVRDARKEAIILCIAALIFALCTLPVACYLLVIMESGPTIDTVGGQFILNFTTWLAVLRWLLFNIFWTIAL